MVIKWLEVSKLLEEGKKAGKNLPIKVRGKLLWLLRKKAENIDDVIDLVSLYVDFPSFKSVVDKYEFVVGLILGISYITESDVLSEMQEVLRKLNIEDISNIEDYYINFGKYFDSRYNKIRYKVYLAPKKGSLAKETSRIPKEKDPEKIRALVLELRDYIDILEAVRDRRIKFFSKVV